MNFSNCANKGILLALTFLLIIFTSNAQSDSSRSELSFDFGITRGRNLNLWPVLKKYKDHEKKELQILYPIYSKVKYFDLHIKHSHLLPLFIADSSAQGTEKRYITFFYPTLFHYQKQTIREETIKSAKFLELAPNISMLGISRSPKGLFVENNLFFFIWHKRDELNQKSRLIAFPLYWHFSTATDTSHLLLPFFYKKKSKDLEKFNLLGVYNYHRSKYKKNHTVFPVWWSREEYYGRDTTSKKIIFPVYWQMNSKIRSHYVFFPLFYNFNYAHYKTTTVIPLFSKGISPDESQSHFGFLNYWKIKNKNKETKLLIPVGWNTKEMYSNDTISKTTFLFMFWSIRSTNKKEDIFPPFFYRYQNSYYRTFSFFPFISYGKQTGTDNKYLSVTPFYWKIRNAHSHKDILIPLAWKTYRYTDKGMIEKTTLFPIYWRTKSKETNNTILFPLVFKTDNKHYSSLTIWPVYSKGISKDSIISHSGFLTWFKVQSPQGTTSFIVPLGWKTKTFQKDDTLTRFTAFPLYWSAKSKVKNNKTLFPLLYYRHNDKRTAITFWPVFTYVKRADSLRTLLSVTPFYWRVREKYYKKDLLIPLAWKVKHYLDHDTVHISCAIPLFYSKRNKNTGTKVIFPFYYSYHNPEYKTSGIFPLFSNGSSADNKMAHLAFFNYFRYRTPNTHIKVLFPLGWVKERYYKNDTARVATLFPIYWSAKSKETKQKYLLPFIYTTQNKGYRSFTFFPLASFGKSADSTSASHLTITPLFWKTNNKQESRTILFPLVWHRKEYFRNDTLVYTRIIPFYFSTCTNNKQNKTIFPIIYSINNKRYKSFTFFPLLSHGHSKDSLKTRSHVMITPLTGRFNSKDKSTTFLFPLITHKRQGDENRLSILQILFRYSSGNSGTRASLLFPLCEYRKENSKRSFRMAPVLWYAKTDTSLMTSIQPLYYSYHSETRNSFILGWYLYKYEKVKEESTAHHFLWRFFYRKKWNNGDFETRFLHIVYANVKRKGKREKSIIPIYRNVRYPDGDRNVSVFFNFYSYFRQYKKEINDSYEEERIFWFIRLRSNYARLKSEGKDKYFRRK
ncbi:MAG: hypothetical protein ACK40G_14590 [Cytophagaceae bacterium]